MTCKDCIHFDVCFIRLFAASTTERIVEDITNPFGVTTKLLSTDCYKDTNGTVCARFINKADVQEKKHGEWVKNYDGVAWLCSECHENPTQGMGYVQGEFNLYDYCPYCGARMDGGKNE